MSDLDKRNPRVHSGSIKTSDRKYRWVRTKLGVVFHDVGILADGTLHNPRGYPEDAVRAAVLATIEEQAQERSQAAKKAAATRTRRRERKIYEIIKKLELGHKYGPAQHCVVCGKWLGDPESIERGIGSDCWQQIINRVVPELKSKLAAPVSELNFS
jgi:hypothetical protein